MNSANEKRDRLLAAAAQAQKSGQYAEAEHLCRQILDFEADCISAKFLLAVLLARRGDIAGAGGLLQDVLEVEPRSYQALVSLATIHLERGAFTEAIALAVRAVELRANDAHAHNLLGRAFLADRQLERAAKEFREAIALQPNFAAAHHNLGRTVQWEGKDGEAAQSFSRAAQLAPSLENLIPLGQTFLALCDFERSEACARHCIEAFPDSASAHLLLCGALIGLGRLDAAETHLQRAMELDTDGREALQLAERQRPLGYIEEANENLRRAIEKNPRHVSAYDSLMHNQKVTERDRPLVDRMQGLLQDRSLGPTEQASLHYGLGKALEDLGEYEASMRHYDEANRITRKIKIGDIAFNECQYMEHVDAQLSTSSLIQSSSLRKDSKSDLPILIIGMMRSGTTLAEQILSSHPKVEPAGELLFWTLNWRRAITEGPEAVAELGREYLDVLRESGPVAERVTDKMPGNYHFVGLIHQALPQAHIIHMRRSPVDTCLSIWATPNHMPHEGGHEKRDTVFVYKQYLRMMEHWRTVLPEDRFLEVDYEDLVSDREGVTRLMVSFCGLDWDDACLHPESNARLVTTPSLWQVRQPVYKTSVDRWRRFEPWLGEFEDLLNLSHPAVSDRRPSI